MKENRVEDEPAYERPPQAKTVSGGGGGAMSGSGDTAVDVSVSIRGLAGLGFPSSFNEYSIAFVGI